MSARLSFLIDAPTVMDWIYRLQERLAVTKAEAVAITVLTGLFLSGLLIQRVWETRATLPADYYAVTDSIFQAHTRHLEANAAEDESWVGVDTTDTLEEAEKRESAVRMNLNTASARQLQRLSGIGPVLAERIIAYREQNGSFAAVEEIKNVSGIGAKTLADIRALLYVEDPEDEPEEP